MLPLIFASSPTSTLASLVRRAQPYQVYLEPPVHRQRGLKRRATRNAGLECWTIQWQWKRPVRDQIVEVHSARDPRLFPGGMSVDVRLLHTLGCVDEMIQLALCPALLSG